MSHSLTLFIVKDIQGCIETLIIYFLFFFFVALTPPIS